MNLILYLISLIVLMVVAGAIVSSYLDIKDEEKKKVIKIVVISVTIISIIIAIFLIIHYHIISEPNFSFHFVSTACDICITQKASEGTR